MPFVSAAVSWKTRRSPVAGLCRVSPERSMSCSPCLEVDVATPASENARGTEMRRARVFAAASPPYEVRVAALLGGRLGDRLLLRVGLGRDGGFGRGTRLRRPLSVLSQLADARLAPDLAAEVVQLRAVDVADRRDVDLVDLRRMERERSLDADAERLLPHGERLACPRALALEHDSLEHLDPLPLPLDHLEVHPDGVARLELRDPIAQLGALEAVDDVAHRKEGRRPRADASECGFASSRA